MDFNGSQETFSQSMFRYGSSTSSSGNVENLVNHNTTNSDYWSQSSNSQQPDDPSPSYSNRPLIFKDAAKHVFQQPHNRPFAKSFRNFYEIHKKKSAEVKQKDVMETFMNLLKECSADIKGTVDSLKTDMAESLKANVETVKTVHINETDKLRTSLKEDMNTSRLRFDKDQETFVNMKEQLAKKNEEIKSQCNKISYLQNEVHSLKIKLESFENKESTFFKTQENKLNLILNSCANHTENLMSSKNLEADTSSKMSNLSSELQVILHQLNMLNNQQNQTNRHNPPNYNNNMGVGGYNQASYPMAAYSQPAACFNQMPSTQYGLQNHESRPVYLPSSSNLAKPLSHYSPLPPFARRLGDAQPRPSPTAIVTPVQRKNIVKEEDKSPQNQCTMMKSAESDVFVLSSDAESCQDISDIITVVKNKAKKNRGVKQCSGGGIAAKTKSATSDICQPSPVQRSIRRYGKIKKNANRITMPVHKTTNGEKVKAGVTIEKLWKESLVESKTDKCLPPANKYAKTSRGSLAMERSQRNVFNFCGDVDHELSQLSNLLTKQKTRHVARATGKVH